MTAGGRVLTRLAAAALLAAAAWWTWTLVRPLPVLDRVRFDVLTASGRFDEAQALLDRHLRSLPADREANFLAAQLLLERPSGPDASDEATARRALDHLQRVRPETDDRRALVRMYEGKALYRLLKWGACETAMLDALQIDPAVPEAGWILLDLYYLEGRPRDAAALALKLFAVEPDPHDRAQYLLELVRQDAQPPDAASIVEQLVPVVAAEPDAVAPGVALGLAQIRNSRAEEGLRLLKELYNAHRDEPAAWDGLMTGHAIAGQPEWVSALLEVLPPTMLDDARFERHRGTVAQWKSDWEAAIEHFQKAIAYDPYDPMLLYRLSQAERRAGHTEEADRLAAAHDDYRAALKEVLPLYQEANELADLGEQPYPDLCERVARLRERMRRPEEARAWRQIGAGAAGAARHPPTPPVAVDRLAPGG